MNFRCRDLDMNVFEFSSDTIPEAISYLNEYEIANKTVVRCFEKETGKRIIGGELKKS